jgi:RNA polymerase sporulation-specific sigma factor
MACQYGAGLSVHAVDDLMQAGRVGLVRALNTYSPEAGANWKTYATRCVRNAILDTARQEYRVRRRISLFCELSTDEEPDFDALTGPTGTSAIEPLLEQIADEGLCAAIQRLLPRDQKILDLYYASEMSDAEIGAALGMSSAAVKMRRHRAQQHLRRAREAVGG